MWPTLLNTDADWKFKTVPQVRDEQLLEAWYLLLTEITSGWLQQP
jgi:hypothetical protein